MARVTSVGGWPGKEAAWGDVSERKTAKTAGMSQEEDETCGKVNMRPLNLSICSKDH